MATYTTNINLTKPEATDNVSVSVLSENFDKIDKAMSCVKVMVPSSGWSSSAPYTQTVTVAGMSEGWIPGNPVLVSSGTMSTDLLAREALDFVSLITSSTGTLTFTCYEWKPTVDFTIRIPRMIGE